MFDRHRDGLNQVQNVLVDGGYTGKPFAAGVRSLLGAAVEVVKRNELHTFVVLPKRWVVERSFAWLEKCRRLWKNCERKLNTSLQMVVLAFATPNPEEIVNRFSDIPGCSIDASASGAVLAWRHFHPGDPVPKLLELRPGQGPVEMASG